MLQLTRRAIQTIIILLLIFIPIFSYYGILLAGKGQREVSEIARDEAGPVSALVYTAIDKVISPPPNPAETIRAIDPFKGGIWSINLFGFNITDPLAGIGATLGGKAIYVPLLGAIIIPLVFILIFGRAFCGWLCPMNTLFELNDRLRGWAIRLGLPSLDIHLDRSFKYLILGASLILTLWGILILPYILPYALVTREVYLYIFYRTLGFGSALILILLLFELLISRRGWCRYLCPGGAFFSLLGAVRLVGVKVDMGRCGEDCDLCTVACGKGLEPHKGDIGIECDNCGLCISACPSKAIKYRVQGSWFRGQIPTVIFVLTLLLVPGPWSLNPVFAAHDTLINPQSGAGGAYPQNPSEEYSSEVDGYLLNFSAFQYLEGTGTYRVKAVVTVRDRANGEPYQGPLTMNLIKRSLFGSKDEGICNFDAPFENRYICYANIPYEANFTARAYFNTGGKEVTAEFPMRVGKPRSHLLFLGSVSVIFIAMVALIAYLKKYQRRPAPVG